MRFTTASGSTYEIIDIDEVEGQGYTGYLIRDGVPLVDINSGGEMGELMAQAIAFPFLPTVGARFMYDTVTHGGCLSTAVEVIHDDSLKPLT